MSTEPTIITGLQNGDWVAWGGVAATIALVIAVLIVGWLERRQRIAAANLQTWTILTERHDLPSRRGGA